MNNLKENLLKQQELSKELNSLILEMDSNEISLDESKEINNINKTTVESDIDSIGFLKKKALIAINDKSITSKEKKNLVKIITELNEIESKYKNLEKEINIYESKGITIENHSYNSDLKDGLKPVKTIKTDNNLNIPLKNTEKNIGFYLINIIGLILVILGISTFGKYIYNNYMNDLIKGIFLYLISFGILGLGEKVLKNKNPKFSDGITALGITAMYISTFINYLFLNNFNEIIALIISLLISIYGISLSNKNNSIIVRILSLIGGFIAIIPMNIDVYTYGYNIVSSLMVVLFVGILNTLNLYKPVNNKEKIALNTSIVINMLFLMTSFLFIDYMTMPVFIIIDLLYIYYIYINEDSDNNTKLLCYGANVLIAILSLNLGFISFIVLIPYAILLSISKAKSSYIISLFIIIDFLIVTYYFENIFTTLILAVISVFIAYIDNEKPNIIFKILYIVQSILFGLSIVSLSNMTILIISTIVNIMSLFMYIKQKEGKMFKCIKYYFALNLISGIFAVMIDLSIKQEIIIILVMIILVGIIYIFNNNELLKDKKIKIDNIICLIIITLFSITLMIGLNLYVLISFIITISSMYLFIDKKYFPSDNDINTIRNITISVFLLINVLNLSDVLSNILILILMMIIAVLDVYIGFKAKDVGLRRTGIGIAILTTVKLILFDLSNMTYLGKTITFIVVGILALVIAYLYSEIDKKYKEK